MNKQTVTNERILEALDIRREIIEAGRYVRLSVDKRIDRILGFCPSEDYKAEFKRYQTLNEESQQYFDQGYRIHYTPRQIRGLGFTIPEDALAWKREFMGHIATTEAERLVWITKTNENPSCTK